jgi:hypothetical protein
MNFLRGSTRWLGAYVVAALVGYTIASVGITAHNLARLGALGIDIGAANAWDTVVFDFKALSPTFGTITKYGSVVWLGFLIAFGTAHVLLVFLSRLQRKARLDLALFALAGATAMAVGLAIIDAQYKVSMISGTGGVSGYLTQLLAGAAAGATFAACRRASGNAGVGS